jgi:hypothetical protein
VIGWKCSCMHSQRAARSFVRGLEIRLNSFSTNHTHRQLLEAQDFVCSYLRFSACNEGNNTGSDSKGKSAPIRVISDVIRLRELLTRCWHRIDTRPEGTLLCVLAWEKRPKFFYVLWRHPGVHTALCTYVFLWKTSVCTPGWRQMMAYFHVSTRKISDKILSEWHFWSSIYSVVLDTNVIM